MLRLLYYTKSTLKTQNGTMSTTIRTKNQPRYMGPMRQMYRLPPATRKRLELSTHERIRTVIYRVFRNLLIRQRKRTTNTQRRSNSIKTRLSTIYETTAKSTWPRTPLLRLWRIWPKNAKASLPRTHVQRKPRNFVIQQNARKKSGTLSCSLSRREISIQRAVLEKWSHHDRPNKPGLRRVHSKIHQQAPQSPTMEWR